MKVRKFYPRSVIRQLSEKSPATLTAGEQAALVFAMRKGRKLGYQVVVSSCGIGSLAGVSAEQAAAILANCNTKILLKVAAAGEGQPIQYLVSEMPAESPAKMLNLNKF